MSSQSNTGAGHAGVTAASRPKDAPLAQVELATGCDSLNTEENWTSKAKREGVALIPKPGSMSGYKAVISKNGSYLVQTTLGPHEHAPEDAVRHVRDRSKFIFAAEAAYHYSRFIGAEAANEEVQRVVETLSRLMTAEEAHARATAEGLVLVPSDIPSGWYGVTLIKGGRKYKVQITNSSGKSEPLPGGSEFSIGEVAAYFYARHIGPVQAHMLLKVYQLANSLGRKLDTPAQWNACRKEFDNPSKTKDEALAEARKDGLTLVQHKDGRYWGVYHQNAHKNKGYQARLHDESIGYFVTSEEAALVRGEIGAIDYTFPQSQYRGQLSFAYWADGTLQRASVQAIARKLGPTDSCKTQEDLTHAESKNHRTSGVGWREASKMTDLTPEQCEARARELKLYLLKSSHNSTGFLNVTRHKNCPNLPYTVDGARNFGSFINAEQAALACACCAPLLDCMHSPRSLPVVWYPQFSPHLSPQMPFTLDLRSARCSLSYTRITFL